MAQLLASTIDGNLTVNGLATFSDGASTRQGLNYIGVNPVNVNTDTPATWKTLGTGVAYINASDKINNQPYTYGFIENKVSGGLVSQIWTSMSGNGAMYHREGNADGWYSGTKEWVQIVDKNNAFKKIWNGTWSSSGNTIAETPNYTMFLVKVKNSSTSEVQGTLIPVFKNGTFIRGVDEANALCIGLLIHSPKSDTGRFDFKNNWFESSSDQGIINGICIDSF